MKTERKILIVGNAESVLCQERDLIKYTTIIRMNKGFPQGKEKYIGYRTDIVATSLVLTPQEIEIYSPQYLYWMSPNHLFINSPYKKYYEKVIKLYPVERWERLHQILGARPTTGCMCVDFFAEEQEVDLLGFDWLDTGSWHWYVDGMKSYKNKYNWEGEKNLILSHPNVKKVIGGKYAN